MPALNLVTVTFKEELNLLELQAESIGRFLSKNDCDSIILIVNQNEQECREHILKFVLHRYGNLQDRVRVFDIEKFVHFRCKPYLMQQVAKINVAKFFKNKQHYTCLDTKNIFIREFDQADFFQGDRPTAYMQPLHGGTQTATNELYSDWLRVRRLEPNEQSMAIMTPFTMDVKHCLDLIRHMETMTGEEFSKAFAEAPRHSEFMLYSTYLRSAGVNPAELYLATKSMSKTYWRHNEATSDEFRASLEDQLKQGRPMIGLHRERLAMLTPEDRQFLTGFFQSLGFKDVERVLSAPA